ncbi:flippase [Desulfobacula sp.]|uniref:flippase n=1 Tax=Desulfobacula sp. TaxID=2593537 RepID=UPI0027148D9D|nr:flippase [Desulfobacula sp.]
MSEIKTLFNQSSHYFAGRIIIMAAGFISFPILTRVFSVSDYGTLGLISTTLFIAIAITKFGFPSSIVRFYAEFKSKNQLTNFYSTLFLGSVAVSATVAAFFYLAMKLFFSKFLDSNIVSLLYLVSILIFTACTIDILTSFLRAEQRTRLYNLIQIIRRYGSLSLGIFLIFFFIKGLYGFYVGQVISGIVLLFFLIYFFRKKIKISSANFSPTIFKDSIKYGFPLVWAELGHLVLSYADRYLIQLYSGSISLGLYTAGYNLSTYATEVIIYPINYAMGPIYMKILVNKGEKETKEFFTKLFRFFLLIIFPVVFGFIAIRKDLLAFLASSKYMEAYTIIPYVVIGQAIYASSIILNSGLFIRKKTYLVTIIMMGACALNVGLNMMLIPRLGIIGAAQATLISYIFYTIVITYYAFKEFSFRTDYPRSLLYLTAATAMYLAISLVDVGSSLGNLVIKIPAGAVIYGILILVFDKEVRGAALGQLAKTRATIS